MYISIIISPKSTINEDFPLNHSKPQQTRGSPYPVDEWHFAQDTCHNFASLLLRRLGRRDNPAIGDSALPCHC